jgi:hypothetical protein
VARHVDASYWELSVLADRCISGSFRVGALEHLLGIGSLPEHVIGGRYLRDGGWVASLLRCAVSHLLLLLRPM